MRFLHTSDWHLGKRIGTFSRYEEQVAVMDEICQIAQREKVDFSVVCGDIFDTYNPPVEAIELYYKTLYRLSADGTKPVIVIAGNHDSPDRIESSDPLARQLGIIQAGYPRLEITGAIGGSGFDISSSFPGCFTLSFADGRFVNIIHSAFSNEQRFSAELSTDGLASQLVQFWEECSALLGTEHPTVLLTHALVSEQGGEIEPEPDGEKSIEHLSPRIYTHQIPESVCYTALGHLHRYQQIGGGAGTVAYSGSPLAYSFSECGQQKYVAAVELATGQAERIALSSGKPLFQKTFDAVDDACEWLEAHPSCWIDLYLRTEQYLTPAEVLRLRDSHRGIVNITPLFTGNMQESATEAIDLTKSRTELFKEYFLSRKSVLPSDEIMGILHEIIAEHD